MSTIVSSPRVTRRPSHSHAHPQATHSEPALNKPELQRRINQLRHIDNVTNWKYIAFEYALFAIVLGAIVGFDFYRVANGMSLAWMVPVALVGIFFMGIVQHRISMIAHEASHWLLFRNQKLNDIVANITSLYPMLSTTHNYRLQHMAHHQFTNHPEKDPDLLYMVVAGGRYQHPMGTWRFWREIALRLFVMIPAQVHYIIIRAKIAAVGGGAGPYAATRKQSKWLSLIGVTYLTLLLGSLIYGVRAESTVMMSAVPIGLTLVMAGIVAVVPETWYMKTAIRPVLPTRWDLFGRLVFHMVLFTTLAWLTRLTGRPWGVYYVLFWLVPLGTMFSFS